MKIFTGILCLLLASAVSGETWQWPDSTPDSAADSAAAASVRIDTKVRFTDDDADTEHKTKNRAVRVDDEVPFVAADDTQGFYNRGAGGGRYPVRVDTYSAPYRIDGNAMYPVHGSNNRNSDGTLDSIQFCKCVIKPDCNPLPNSASACGAGKYLCCYRRPNSGSSHSNEFFNEIEDERPMLLPGQENLARPFPPPPGTELNGMFGPGHGHESALLGTLSGHNRRPNQNFNSNSGVLVGPEGPTGVIGPAQQRPAVLTGPGGPTGIIGPAPLNQNRGPAILIGPDGPQDNIRQSESAQRGVLVGPGGPTGIIGPAGFNRRPVLVGPGGPTGMIGPGRQRGVLVGPGGPTGHIGPGRQVLVGPGGPSGYIGPLYNYFGK